MKSYKKLLKRIKQCQEIAYIEGTEIADAINGLCDTANTLYGIGYEKEARKCVTMAETVCTDYIKQCWDDGIEDIERVSDELFEYFMGMNRAAYRNWE